jgi:hypothetical protein
VNNLKELGLVGSVANYAMEVSGSSSVSGTASAGGAPVPVSVSVSASVSVRTGGGSNATIFNSIEEDNFTDAALLSQIQYPEGCRMNVAIDPTKVFLPAGFRVKGNSSGSLTVIVEMGRATGVSANASYYVASASASFDSTRSGSLTISRPTTQQTWE